LGLIRGTSPGRKAGVERLQASTSPAEAYNMDMPVYLFTYHAYRSWMPDRPEGFVQEGRGIEAPNP
jgi:hypothetical protein